MRLIATAVLAAALLTGCMTGAAYGQNPACTARKDVVEHLRQKYKEVPAVMGIANGGQLVEFLASPEGSWTLIVTYPNGTSCMVGAGKHYEILPVPVKGEAM